MVHPAATSAGCSSTQLGTFIIGYFQSWTIIADRILVLQVALHPLSVARVSQTPESISRRTYCIRCASPGSARPRPPANHRRTPQFRRATKDKQPPSLAARRPSNVSRSSSRRSCGGSRRGSGCGRGRSSDGSQPVVVTK